MPVRRVLLSVTLALGSTAACGRQPPPAAPPALPQASGTFVADGVTAPVRIVRDRWGIPHIYAASRDDLFFAQGFVQAQDRLFQMDLWRRSAQGRLSEVLGSNFIERDAMTRRIQFRGDMRAEWASYGPDTEAIANAFVRGVNAWVDVARERLPEDFALAGWSPEYWKPEDLTNRTDAFLASANASAEVFRARLVASIGVRRADALVPPSQSARTDVARGLDVKTISYVIADALRSVGAPPVFSGLAAPLSTVRLQPNPGQGSNAWAVSGQRAASGAPLLAVDPHRGLAHPSFRYLVHLNAPGWNVIGAAAPWLPGVVIGHNDRIAWGMTSWAADVQDLYVEEINPSQPHQVRRGGAWVDTERVADPIVVKGRPQAFDFEREYTAHGVLIASDREHHRAFTLRWTGFEPGTAAELGALVVSRAQTEQELRAAIMRWKSPAVTVVSASAEGRVSSLRAALVPVRRSWNGELPVPGWTGAHEWQGWLSTAGPRGPQGALDVVWSANDSPARTSRIRDLLEGQRTFGVDDFKKLQHDTLAWNAERLVPLLTQLRSDDVRIEAARQQLLQWDRRMSADSSAASLYAAWERQLMRSLAEAAVPSELRDEFAVRAGWALVPALTGPTRLWFGGNPRKARDDLLVASLTAVVESARGSQPSGPLPWGRLHQTLFAHPLGITQAARARFNIGPFEQPGYAETVLSTTGPDLGSTIGASFRAIFDVGDWDRSVVTNAPGQSGWRGSPHFGDLATMWAAGEYFPLVFSDRAVQGAAESTLVLTPRQ